MVAQVLNRNTAEYDSDEASVTIGAETFYLTRLEDGWWVGSGGAFEHFYSARVAAGHFRQLVEAAQLQHEAQRRMDALAMERFRANHPVGSEWQVDAIEYNAAMDSRGI